MLGKARLWEGNWGLHSYWLWITKGQSGVELPNGRMGVNSDAHWGICVLGREASSLLPPLPSPSGHFCHLVTLREKWGNNCNQGTACEHTSTRGKLQHIVLACNYWASRLLSITCTHSQECSLHSLWNGYPKFKIFSRGERPITPDFAPTLLSSHVGNVFKTIWVDPLFFC